MTARMCLLDSVCGLEAWLSYCGLDDFEVEIEEEMKEIQSMRYF